MAATKGVKFGGTTTQEFTEDMLADMLLERLAARRANTTSGASSAVEDGSKWIPPEGFAVGSVVFVKFRNGSYHEGVVHYIGTLEYFPGDWIGIEMRLPVGTHTGTHLGKRYFKCPHSHGIFVRPAAVELTGEYEEVEPYVSEYERRQPARKRHSVSVGSPAAVAPPPPSSTAALLRGTPKKAKNRKRDSLGAPMEGRGGRGATGAGPVAAVAGASASGSSTGQPVRPRVTVSAASSAYTSGLYASANAKARSFFEARLEARAASEYNRAQAAEREKRKEQSEALFHAYGAMGRFA